jgi:nitrogen fixation/metabolism regulation signal transduction histidine kinase
VSSETRASTSIARAGRPRRRSPGHQHRIATLAVLTGLPGTLVALALLWSGQYSSQVRWVLTGLVLAGGVGAGVVLIRRTLAPLSRISSLLVGLGEGDFSLRAHGARPDDVLGRILLEINRLAETLHEHRVGAREASALLLKVMAEIDIPVFAFDDEQKLRLVNQRGVKLLRQPRERLIGRMASELGLDECLEGEVPRIVDLAFPGGSGRWEIRHSTFREGGLPRRLLVLSDLTQTLREEERQAWRKLIQVLRHEINNSLAPIDSLAGSLTRLLDSDPRPAEGQDHLREGLGVIQDRSHALNRFMTAYTRLTRLPPPSPADVDVAGWVRRVAGLETRLEVTVEPGPELVIEADGDQLDQLLINLLHNAVDAALETGGGVRVGWTTSEGPLPWLDVVVEDDGPGLSNTENLFVPFFTTKPDGAGIGLPLSREIAEAHGGRLTVENRKDRSGCRAHLRLPAGRTHDDDDLAS